MTAQVGASDARRLAPDLVTYGEVAAALDQSPRSLPPVTRAALGAAGTLSGPGPRAAEPPDSPARPVYLGELVYRPQVMPPVAGTLRAAVGQIEVTLPQNPPARQESGVPVLEYFRALAPGEVCTVSTLSTGPAPQGEVRVIPVTVSTPRAALGQRPQRAGTLAEWSVPASAAERFVSSPLADFVTALPFSVFPDTGQAAGQEGPPMNEELRGILLWSSADVAVRGERRCAMANVTKAELRLAEQTNVFVNVSLKRGWNVLRRQYTVRRTAALERVNDITVTGDAAAYRWTPQP